MPGISFENTAIAFAYKDNRALFRAWLLFTLLSSPLLVSLANLFLKLALRLHLPVAWLVRPTVYQHFVGGETLAECTPTV
ncbi:MAG TPA: proline dehydrogenase, partial [Bacteroidales bacterium]|nr:proline dehydrogenase [Bacteroidales bacterium]